MPKVTLSIKHDTLRLASMESKPQGERSKKPVPRKPKGNLGGKLDEKSAKSVKARGLFVIVFGQHAKFTQFHI